MHPFQSQRSISTVVEEAQNESSKQGSLTEQTLQQYRDQTMKDYSIMVEYKRLTERAPGGVYLAPSFNSLLHYEGVIFLRQGLYRNGIFKFKLELPENYPADGAVPRVTFFSKVFHPYVDLKTGELDMTPKFQQWRAGHDRLERVLLYIKKLFYMHDFCVLNASNEEASELYRDNKKEFITRVEACVSLSLDQKFLNPKGAVLRFTEAKPQHERVAQHILGAGELEPSAETAVAESSPAETAVAESSPAVTAVAESSPAETAVAESSPAETAVAESSPAETAVAKEQGLVVEEADDTNNSEHGTTTEGS